MMAALYLPPPDDDDEKKEMWETTQEGYDELKMKEAVEFAKMNEFQGHGVGEDVEAYLFKGGMTAKNEGKNATIVGPTKVRGPVNGMVLVKGRIAAEWGDTSRPDMTFSVTKSYLSTVASFAWMEGHMRATADGDDDKERGLDDSVLESERRHHGDIRPEHEANEDITWRQLLQQTSEWRGSLWGKPDVVDHNRSVGNTPNMTAAGEEKNARKGEERAYRSPGTYWEYNDVRVNRLSLALMRVLDQPVPAILREKIMLPIGSSSRWDWHGYSTSWEKLKPSGVWAKGVSGGGHWGGGLHISARDHARFGLLLARGGKWNDKQLIPEGWIEVRDITHTHFAFDVLCTQLFLQAGR